MTTRRKRKAAPRRRRPAKPDIGLAIVNQCTRDISEALKFAKRRHKDLDVGQITVLQRVASILKISF